MSFKQIIKSKKFIVTSETAPPKGVNTAKMLDNVRPIIGRVDAINVTDLQSAVMRLGSLAACSLLKQQGVEPILQVTCRDRNRLSLQSELLSAYALGIENVLVLTGDHTLCGDHPQAKPVFDLDSVQLLSAAKGLCSGRDMSGAILDGAPDLCLGAVVNPCADPLEPELIKMKKKIDSGAQFFQTQAVFDTKKFDVFMAKASKYNVPILAGIILLKSSAMALYMNENVAGIYVPDDTIKRLNSSKDRKKEAVDIACELISALRGACCGVHIMPIGWDNVLPEVLDRLL